MMAGHPRRFKRAGNPGVTSEIGTAAVADGNAASTGASLQKSSAPVFGIANIGVETETGLSATIWRNTTADRAARLLDGDAVLGSSPALSSLAHDVVAQRAVPARRRGGQRRCAGHRGLDWMAASGRSQTLETLVGQLPDEPWLEWKQWLVETQLMARRDDEACRTVMYQVSRTFEPFWHKAKVICSAAMGDAAGAQFAADILSAMGVDDAVFSALVAKLLNDTDPGPIDPSLLKPLHIVLMDAAHDIDATSLGALADASVQTAVGLRYLDADARRPPEALDRGLVDHRRAASSGAAPSAPVRFRWRSRATEPTLAADARPRLACPRRGAKHRAFADCRRHGCGCRQRGRLDDGAALCRTCPREPRF